MTDITEGGGHSAENARPACHYCGPTDRELRPYGPGGSHVCFPCATATPEREQAAQNAFGGLLDAVDIISPGPVLIGTQAGPVPFDPRVVQAGAEPRAESDAHACCAHCLANDAPHPLNDHTEPCDWCVIPPAEG